MVRKIYLLIILLLYGCTNASIGDVIGSNLSTEENTFINDYPQFYNHEVVLQDKGLDIIIKDVEFMPNFHGNSMSPTLTHGNTLLLREIVPNDVQIGMTVVYQSGDNMIVHRVIAVYPDHVFLKGDNNVKDDGKIDKQVIKYVVVGVLYT